jgi:hypothetical protein
MLSPAQRSQLPHNEREIDMPLRYASGRINFASLGAGLVTHGLGATPTEYGLVDWGASHMTLNPASIPDTTAIYITCITGVAGNASVSVFASIPHSWIL